MTLSDLIERMFRHHDITKAEARRMIATVFDAITDAAARGDDTAIRDFGTFRVRRTPARQGRNPRTGETIALPATATFRFTPAKAIKSRLNGSRSKTLSAKH